jgi:hypothetical protein
MKISYAITVCNELEEVKRLIEFLYLNKRQEDEICVLVDKPKASKELLFELYKYETTRWIILKESEFKEHFANWKNQLMDICSGSYIFQIDADEIPHINLMQNLPALLEENQLIDMIRVPRVNTVEGLTEEHVQKWGWNVNEKGWVNWADWQMRIYKNTPDIKWKNKVHEVLDGFKTHGMLPIEEEWALYHPKTIERQQKQNNYYESI